MFFQELISFWMTSRFVVSWKISRSAMVRLFPHIQVIPCERIFSKRSRAICIFLSAASKAFLSTGVFVISASPHTHRRDKTRPVCSLVPGEVLADVTPLSFGGWRCFHGPFQTHYYHYISPHFFIWLWSCSRTLTLPSDSQRCSCNRV